MLVSSGCGQPLRIFNYDQYISSLIKFSHAIRTASRRGFIILKTHARAKSEFRPSRFILSHAIKQFVLTK